MPDYSGSTYIYVMAEADNGPFKLGVTCHPSSRLASLRSALAMPRLRLFGEWYADRLGRSVEMLAHDKLSNYAIGSEWFGFHASMGVYFMERLATDLRLSELLGPYSGGRDYAPRLALEQVQRRITAAWKDWRRVPYEDPGDERDDP